MSSPAETVTAADRTVGTEVDDLLADRLSRLDLPAKVRLLTGADFWSLHSEETIGLRRMVFSDGPAGIRGEVWDERQPSLNLPSGSALGATWDVDAARRYGDLLGREARRKAVDVVLGPTINLHRSPYGGRHFEAMSEDPLLTGHLAAAYVEAVQAHGVAACPKHYVANEYEIERHTASSEVDERTLREIYLATFEQAVVEARTWTVMSAYNSVNGTTMSEHALLRDPLKTSWGFDGVVVSDWIAVKTTEASARSAQDLVMPSVLSPWEDALVAAVREGRVAEEAIDEKVLRLLRLAARVGALAGVSAAPRIAGECHDPLLALTELAAESMVLLRNRGELPWSQAPRSIAVIGPNGLVARTQGGGSASVSPESVVSPLDGLRARFPNAAVSFRMGVEAPTVIFPFARDLMHDPVSGEPGVHVTLTDTAGEVVFDEVRLSSELAWLGTLPENAGTMVMRTRYTPEISEKCDLGVACVGAVRLELDGEVVIDEHLEIDMEDIARALFAPPVSSVPVELVVGRPVDVTVICDLTKSPLPMVHSVIFGMAPRSGPAEEMLAEAVAAAAAAEVAVVVVGTSSRTESEGFDRTSLALPGDQDRLVEAVARANPRTVVVVNAGSPVLMPWRDQVSAILLGWFGGQQMGTALAEILAGDREPGGRLPTTWPADEQSVPVGPDQPVDGKVHYAEGLDIGYRAWLRADVQPAYCFGHGLGYTSWSLSGFEAPAKIVAGESLRLRIAVENTGSRPGKEVLQVYAARPRTAVSRPVRWLVGFAAVRLEPGERRTVSIDVPARGLAAWVDGDWWYEPGMFELSIGTSVDALELATAVEVIS